MTYRVLAIDDEPANLLMIEEYLSGGHYAVTTHPSAEDGLAALRAGERYDAILLDRMMPGMGGIGFMREIARAEEWKGIPVIMQTAAASPAEVSEGLAAGVYYYLTKPYKKSTLLPILERALRDTGFRSQVEERAARTRDALANLRSGRFAFRTLEDVDNVSSLVGSAFADPVGPTLALRELMLNAVEHGNLGVTYDEKSALNARGEWEAELRRRLVQPGLREREASLAFARDDGGIEIAIEDCGPGFDWQRYLEIDPSRAFDSHGRGIAIARTVAFDEVAYVAPGNRVVCRKRFG